MIVFINKPLFVTVTPSELIIENKSPSYGERGVRLPTHRKTEPCFRPCGRVGFYCHDFLFLFHHRKKKEEKKEEDCFYKQTILFKTHQFKD